MFDAVCFDLDGTLCRRTQDVDAAFAAAFERVGIDPLGDPADLWAALDGAPDPDDRAGYLGAGFARLAARRGRTDVDPIALAEAFLAEVDNARVELLPGADRALRRAAEAGATALVTNGPADRQATKVEALDLADRVDAVVYAGDLPRRKPHAAPFERALEAVGAPPERALHVGDSLAYDVAGAQVAGLDAAWIRGEGEDPAPYAPEFVLDGIGELVEVLE